MNVIKILSKQLVWMYVYVHIKIMFLNFKGWSYVHIIIVGVESMVPLGQSWGRGDTPWTPNNDHLTYYLYNPVNWSGIF